MPSRLLRIEKGEGRGVFWAGAYFFFLLGSYYVIRPLRDEMGIAGSGGTNALSWLFVGTLAGTLAANPLFAALVSRYPRRVFLPVVYRVLSLNLVVFWALLTFLHDPARLAVARFFFVWASVFNMFAVSVFWGFMVDLFRADQGKRLFGMIGAGGTLGGIAGSAVTAALARVVGPVPLILVAAAFLEIAVLCVRQLSDVYRVDVAREGGEGAPPGRGFVEGVRMVVRSPYLGGICLFLLFFTVSSTFLYFEQARIVKAAFRSAGERTAYFARIDLYVNLLTALTQSSLTGRILSWLGVGPALSALAVVTAGGFGALALRSTTGVLLVVQVVRRAAEFAVVRPAREVLFTVVSREEKYTSKTFIDTFVYRGGDVVGAWADRLLVALGLGPAGLAMAFTPVAVAWIALSLRLGRRQSERAGERSRGADAPLTVSASSPT